MLVKFYHKLQKLDQVIQYQSKKLNNNNNNKQKDRRGVMARYKIEREYIFSNKSYSEICNFLKKSDRIDLLKVRDKNGNTALHQAAYHEQQIKLLKKYLEYMQKYCSNLNINNMENQIRKDPQEYFNQFINCQNDQGLTPLHFAAYKGNYKILDQLCKSGADYKQTTKSGQNILHLAAQSGKIQTFIFFQSLLDINCRDSKNSTPLHWAAYKNNQAIVTYLLSHPNIDINALDKNNQTPLHLATTIGHTNIVKKLLIAGADRSIKNKKQQTALAIAQYKQYHNIEKILNQNYSCLEWIKLYLNIKKNYKPQSRTIKKPIFFICCFIILALIRHLLFNVDPIYQYLIWCDAGFNLILLVLYCTLIFQSKKRKPQKFIDFLNGNIDLNKVCLVCSVLKPHRSQHCNVCKVCVQRYDHHCFWINNCVGKKNLKKFIIFTILFLIFLLQMMVFSIVIILAIFTDNKTIIHPRQDNSYKNIQQIISIIYSLIIGLLSLSLTFPMIVLIYVQITNIFLNQTTYQRYTKQKIQNFIQTSSHLLISQIKSKKKIKYSISNALDMCHDQHLHEGLTSSIDPNQN